MWRAAWAALACAVLATPSLSDQVTLSAVRGSFAVSGELQSYDGIYYRVLTEDGPVTLRAEAVSCTGRGCLPAGATTGFTISASNDLANVLLPALIRSFAASEGLTIELNPGANEQVFILRNPGQDKRSFPITLRLTSSSEAVADLAAQASDLAIIDRSLSDAELIFLRDAGLGDMDQPDHERLLALDGLMLAVSPQRPETSVSLDLLAQTLSDPGALMSDLGLATRSPAKLTLRAQAEDLPKLTTWMGKIAVPVDYRLGGFAVAQTLRGDPERIGVLPASARGATRGLRLVEPCGLSHAPDATQLTTGRYPWILPIKSYLPDGRVLRDLELFMAFLETDRADRVIRRSGFARPGSQPIDSNLPERALAALNLADQQSLPVLQDLVRSLADADQIGLSIPAKLESGPMRGLRRLAVKELAKGLSSGTLPVDRVLLLASGANTDEAQRHVDILFNDLAEQAPQLADDLPRLRVSLDGGLLPVACPDAPWADWMMARIDVWLLPALTDTPRPEN